LIEQQEHVDRWTFTSGATSWARCSSRLLMDCLELAADARELDMRASLYDLSGYGFAAIRVE